MDVIYWCFLYKKTETHTHTHTHTHTCGSLSQLSRHSCRTFVTPCITLKLIPAIDRSCRPMYGMDTVMSAHSIISQASASMGGGCAKEVRKRVKEVKHQQTHNEVNELLPITVVLFAGVDLRQPSHVSIRALREESCI